VLTDYASIENILTKQHAVFDRDSMTSAIFHTILPKAMISLKTGPMWKHHRRLIGPAMTSKYLRQSMPKVHEAFEGMLTLWKLKIEKSDGKGFSVIKDTEDAAMVGFSPSYLLSI
jgi:cytochrome P450